MTETASPTFILEKNQMVAMRDGVRLATDIYRPQSEGRWPVLLTRVPYNKNTRFVDEDRNLFVEMNLELARVVQAGYVVVAQDTRGCFASEGTFEPFLHEANDGADTIAWIASQPWSTGVVGMFGVSYQGITQWQAAIQHPEALRAIAPTQSTKMALIPYQGGAFLLSQALGWSLTHHLLGEMQCSIEDGQSIEQCMQAMWRAATALPQAYAHLPLVDAPLSRDKAPFYFEWLAHPLKDDYWRSLDPVESYSHVTVPAFIISGWRDGFLMQDLAHFQTMRRQGGSAEARQRTRILIGPWSHGDFTGRFSDRDYGAVANAESIDLTGLQLRWFDHWLKGIENGSRQDPPVRLFVMGLDQWRDEEDWPLPDTQYRPLYLHSNGHANSATGDGSLLNELPGEEPEDVYLYDPLNPVPSVGSRSVYNMGAELLLDQRELETRADVLCYTTPPLEQPVEVTGPIELILYVASSARDTDFTGKLVDVFPDGRAELLIDGILRARYRESLSVPELMEPGTIYKLYIDMGATANVFLPGHRIRLEVSSSNFPCFDRNTNTGGEIAHEREADMQQATNRIYHDSAHASHLILPFIERGNAEV